MALFWNPESTYLENLWTTIVINVFPIDRKYLIISNTVCNTAQLVRHWPLAVEA
jgi:hypothetical protein